MITLKDIEMAMKAKEYFDSFPTIMRATVASCKFIPNMYKIRVGDVVEICMLSKVKGQNRAKEVDGYLVKTKHGMLTMYEHELQDLVKLRKRRKK